MLLIVIFYQVNKVKPFSVKRDLKSVKQKWIQSVVSSRQPKLY